MRRLSLLAAIALTLTPLAAAKTGVRDQHIIPIAIQFPFPGGHSPLGGGGGGTDCGAGGGINCRKLGSCKWSANVTCTTSSFTLNTGETIIAWSATPGLPATVNFAWNSLALTEIGTGGGIGSVESHLAHKDNVTGASATMTCSDSSSTNIATGVCYAIAITGAQAAPFDTGDTHTTGNNTTPGTTTVTPSVAPGLSLFLIAEQQNTAATAGSWVGPAASIVRDGNPSGTCCVIDAGYQTFSSTVGQNAAMTGVATGNWVSWLVILKQ